MATKKTGQPGSDAGGDTAIATEVKKKEKLAKPKLYKVLFHNDNYTTMEFVVAVLREVFHRSEADAYTIMLHVHRTGVGIAGVYTYEIAETKVKKTEELARAADFPLRVTLEPEDS